jgi:tetratricopeptide (TPR) repeat protein
MYEILLLDSEHSDAINFIAYSFAERGVELEKALEMAQKALALNNVGHIQDTVGWVYFKMGDYPNALKYLKMAVEGMPSDLVVLQHLGDIYAAMGKYREARETYEKILEINSEEKDVIEKLKRLPEK